MTEMVSTEGQSSSNFAPAPITSPAPSAQSEERTFRQSEVNELVGRAKSEAVERYRRESSVASHQNSQQREAQPYTSPPVQAPTQPQYQGMSQDEYRRVAAEEAQRARNEWIEQSQRYQEEQNAQKIATEFFTKVGAGDGGMQTFEKAVAESGLDLRSIPHHVQLANRFENTREIMLDLMKNPSKIGVIQNLIDIDLRAGRNPSLATAEMKRLSESIKTNQKAGSYQSANEPLSQMRPANAGTGNTGALSIADYKRKYRV